MVIHCQLTWQEVTTITHVVGVNYLNCQVLHSNTTIDCEEHVLTAGKDSYLCG